MRGCLGKCERVRRARFLAAHPCCCFCGGGIRAETEDHIPARSLFVDRQWPEGFVFPACRSCNSSSRFDGLLKAAPSGCFRGGATRSPTRVLTGVQSCREFCEPRVFEHAQVADVAAANDGGFQLSWHGAYSKRQETVPRAPMDARTSSPAATGTIGPKAPLRMTSPACRPCPRCAIVQASQ